MGNRDETNDANNVNDNGKDDIVDDNANTNGNKSNDDHEINNKVALFNIPPEIFLPIIDNLGLGDQFILSQTSRALRHVFSRDWVQEMSQLGFKDSLRFWAAVASRKPDHWACSHCCRLHPVDTSDTPNTPRDPPCFAEYGMEDVSKGYTLQESHVQNALKLHRLGNQHQDYLAGLMRPYSTFSKREFMFENAFTESYTLNPRIIDNRFIIQEEWIIQDEDEVDRALSQHVKIYACPHVGVFDGGYLRSIDWKMQASELLRRIRPGAFEITILESMMRLAVKGPGYSMYDSCPRCPTDYEVVVSEDQHTATIRAWHDFGGEGAPVDTGWDAHVRSPGPDDWMYRGFAMREDGGRVRRLWLSSTS
ncbi:uncharacterized protein TRIVIDRAFT_203028 [Trichoderma virens Gv29-8]|uniref:F-box domain-containing protein n=1 Tax=Hypocrea virens (strain Gv29-8 / FGSC 10586) TaxID=413071 RepID=G9MZ77_HYPVG|nr:uncharacterized protein TRIVIDRAFT_203028 [Trichoderma virens Gv29-8]EHK20403.1 hypothetical protein TRIVIDRAFT_203028 [Trichoderma virens Gv29-8]